MRRILCYRRFTCESNEYKTTINTFDFKPILILDLYALCHTISNNRYAVAQADADDFTSF